MANIFYADSASVPDTNPSFAKPLHAPSGGCESPVVRFGAAV